MEFRSVPTEAPFRFRSVREGPLTVEIDRDGESFAVSAIGELHASTALALEGSLRTVLSRGASSIILDLRELTSIDGSGVRVLLWASEHAREVGDRLRIRAGSSAIGSMLRGFVPQARPEGRYSSRSPGS